MVTMEHGNQDWTEIRSKVWKRDKGFCQCCKKHRSEGIALAGILKQQMPMPLPIKESLCIKVDFPLT